jgi:Right handed beta helix region
VIEGADDQAWRDSGFGAHIMIMGLGSKIHVDGVEIRRAGQAGTLARYPFHWHLLSYAGNGQLMGDAVGHVLKNSAIWNSSQRCIVVHATNGVQLINNVCHDIKGHAVFLEDAVERRNLIEGNLVLMTRMPADAQRLAVHEGAVFEGGSSGFWLTNPDNIVRNNHAGDVHGNGFWMAFPEKPLGDSKAVAIVPNNVPLGAFERNTAHSAREPGLLLEHAPFDDAGNVRPTNYRPKNPDGSPSKHTLSEITTFKNTGGAYRNRASATRSGSLPTTSAPTWPARRTRARSPTGFSSATA